ncbi:uncharacterized protein LOC135712311 [Ochlerotatus camptorhynchus]|uniref:uncharacterized protein LOC135712311 n=1 Tax=Ochlerotatus camptorhynchus TaxID=644619 RepID=UPI0031E3596A
MLALIRVSKDELTNALLTSENISWTQWDVDEIFGRLVRWRQQNGYEIIDFTKVEVEEFWIEEAGEEQQIPVEENEEVSAEENSQEISREKQVDSCYTNTAKPRVPVAVTASNPQEPGKENKIKAVKDSNHINSVKSINSLVPLNIIPRRVLASGSDNTVSSRTGCLPAVLVDCSSKKTDAQISTDISCPQHKKCSDSVESSATETHECHLDDVQVKLGIANGKKTASEFSVIECSNHHFTPSILSGLLDSTITGKQIIERGNLGPLTTESQRELVSIIADYHYQKGLQASERILDEYATSITALFKSESKVNLFML